MECRSKRTIFQETGRQSYLPPASFPGLHGYPPSNVPHLAHWFPVWHANFVKVLHSGQQRRGRELNSPHPPKKQELRKPCHKKTPQQQQQNKEASECVTGLQD